MVQIGDFLRNSQVPKTVGKSSGGCLVCLDIKNTKPFLAPNSILEHLKAFLSFHPRESQAEFYLTWLAGQLAQVLVEFGFEPKYVLQNGGFEINKAETWQQSRGDGQL